MADLGTVGIAIEVRGREALRQLENDMVVVDRSAKSAARSFEAFERAGLKTAETFRYVSDAAKRRLADEQRITQELVKQRTAAEQLAKANAQKFQSQIGSNLGLGARGISAGASASAFEGEIERLRIKYDQIYASSQLYEKSLTELNQAHALGVLSVKQHEAAVEALNVEYQNFQNGVGQAGNRFQQYTAQTRSGMNGLGVAIQQTGYQVGDFLVQVQSGTNWMVAFGQQATQLVGILPMMGAGFMGLSMGALVALSAGLGIAIPLVTAIGAAFMRTGKDAEEGAKGIDTQKQAFDALRESIKQLRLEQQMASSGLDETRQKATNELVKLQANLNVLLAEQQELQAQAAASFSTMQTQEQQANDAAIEAIRVQIKEAQNLLKIEEEERRLVNAIEAERAIKLALSSRNADDLNRAMEDALDAGVKFSKLDLSSIVALAAEKGWSLASAIRAAFAAADGGPIVNANASRGPGFEGGGRSGSTMAPYIEPALTLEQIIARDTKTTGGSGGGGGGGGNSRLTSLLDSLQTEREVIEGWYAESQTILQSASESELAVIGGYNEAKLRLEQEYQERLKGIRDLGNQTALGQAQTFFGDMASALQSGNDKMLKAGRAFAAVEATINAYRAYAQTIADPSLPWWAKIPKALAVLSAGMSVVSAIKGGGSAGGASGPGSATVASSASAPSPQTVYIDSLDPDGLYSGQALINLFDAFYNENDKRGKVFVVAR